MYDMPEEIAVRADGRLGHGHRGPGPLNGRPAVVPPV